MMKNMKRKLMETYVKGRAELLKAVEQFLDEEKGASHLVEIIVVIVIIIGIAAIFRTQLTAFVNQVMEDLLNF